MSKITVEVYEACVLYKWRTLSVSYHSRKARNKLDRVLDVLLCDLHRRAVLLLQGQRVSASLGHPLVHLNTHRQQRYADTFILCSLWFLCDLSAVVYNSAEGWGRLHEVFCLLQLVSRKVFVRERSPEDRHDVWQPHYLLFHEHKQSLVRKKMSHWHMIRLCHGNTVGCG